MPPLQTSEQKQAAERGAAMLGFNGVDNARTSLGLDTLNSTPTKASLPQTKQGTEGAGLRGMLETPTDYTKQLTDTATTAQTNADQAFSGYLEGLLGTTGQTQATDQAYKNEGVDTLQKKLNTYDQQLTMEQNALKRRIQTIEKNASGGLREGIQNEIDRVERESLAKQADISVVRAGVAQDYSTAKAIADRSVAVQMEQQGIKNEALRVAYERNQSLFDKSEQRAFEAKQKERDRAYEDEKDTKQKISDMSLYAMQNGADGDTVMAIRTAKTPEDAYRLAANYMSPILIEQRRLENEAKRASTASAYALAGQRSGAGAAGESGTYANDMEALTGTVLATIPTKFGQQQFKDQIAKARNDSDRLNIIASQVLKGQSTEVRKDFANQAIGISEIDKALQMLDNGVQTGVINNTAQYVYNLAGKDFDPKLAEINSHIIAALQPYRNSVTGAAWGTQEDQEYQSLFGSTKYSPEELRMRLNTLKEILKGKSATTLNAYANPMGYGQNQFSSGAYAPNEAQNGQQGMSQESLDAFDSIMGTSQSTEQSAPEQKGYVSNLVDSTGNFIKAIFGQ